MNGKNYHRSPRATLAAVGLKLQALQLLAPIREKVKIAQKKIKHEPLDKLQDALITILAGAHGLCEINTRLRADPALQRAFGREACADQSVVQATLNACTSTNVAQMMEALDAIFQKHSLGARHDFKAALLLVDVDLTGMPCGKKAEGSAKGYQGKAGIGYGRQMGRAIAAQYEEVVIDRLYPDNLHLTQAIRPMIEDCERTLSLDEAKRKRTVIRMDAGGGSLDQINWLLERGYQVHCKDISGVRAEGLAQAVKHWVNDPKRPGRQLGWVKLDAPEYVRPVKRLTIRWPKDKSGKIMHALLISTLEPAEVISMLGLPKHLVHDADAVVLAYGTLYDKRGGAMEAEIKESKQGIGITKRSKKRFEAQQMVMLLGSLAHNLIVWSRRWVTADAPRFARYGALRMVRDLFNINGLLEFGEAGRVIRITLNQAAPLAREMALALAKLLAGEVEIKVGVT